MHGIALALEQWSLAGSSRSYVAAYACDTCILVLEAGSMRSDACGVLNGDVRGMYQMRFLELADEATGWTALEWSTAVSGPVDVHLERRMSSLLLMRLPRRFPCFLIAQLIMQQYLHRHQSCKTSKPSNPLCIPLQRAGMSQTDPPYLTILMYYAGYTHAITAAALRPTRW